jgi:hypothetical protein
MQFRVTIYKSPIVRPRGQIAFRAGFVIGTTSVNHFALPAGKSGRRHFAHAWGHSAESRKALVRLKAIRAATQTPVVSGQKPAAGTLLTTLRHCPSGEARKAARQSVWPPPTARNRPRFGDA